MTQVLVERTATKIEGGPVQESDLELGLVLELTREAVWLILPSLTPCRLFVGTRVRVVTVRPTILVAQVENTDIRFDVVLSDLRYPIYRTEVSA